MSKSAFLHGDNVVLAELDTDRDAHAAAASIISAARGVPAPKPAPKPAAKQPLWWKVTIVKHSDAKVIRSVTGRRPTVAEIRKHGWHEVHDDGDEHFVHPDAIAEIAIEGGFATAPADALAAHMINPKQRGTQ